MKRFCSQLTFCAPDKVLKQAIIEQNQENVITAILSLSELRSETSHTLFLDGIISTEIISLKEHLSPADLHNIKETYQYVDLSGIDTNIHIDVSHSHNKPLIIDFGTSATETINKYLKNSFPFLYKFPAIEIIAACTYYPSLITHQPFKIEIGEKANLILWKGINLVNKEITGKIRTENISSGI